MQEGRGMGADKESYLRYVSTTQTKIFKIIGKNNLKSYLMYGD